MCILGQTETTFGVLEATLLLAQAQGATTLQMLPSDLDIAIRIARGGGATLCGTQATCSRVAFGILRKEEDVGEGILETTQTHLGASALYALIVTASLIVAQFPVALEALPVLRIALLASRLGQLQQAAALSNPDWEAQIYLVYILYYLEFYLQSS